MIVPNRERALESIVALQMALDPVKSRRTSAYSSKSLIEQGTVAFIEGEANVTGVAIRADGQFDLNVTRVPQSFASGIFITTDFILTANHAARKIESLHRSIDDKFAEKLERDQNVPHEILKYTVVDSKGNSYLVDPTLYLKDSAHDIALVRVVSQYSPRPRPFRVISKDLSVGQALSVVGAYPLGQPSPMEFGISRKFTRLRAVHGNTAVENGEVIKDCFFADLVGGRGYSGGPFMTQFGEFAGILVGGNEQQQVIVGTEFRDIYTMLRSASYYIAKEVISGRHKNIYSNLHVPRRS